MVIFLIIFHIYPSASKISVYIIGDIRYNRPFRPAFVYYASYCLELSLHSKITHSVEIVT